MADSKQVRVVITAQDQASRAIAGIRGSIERMGRTAQMVDGALKFVGLGFAAREVGQFLKASVQAAAEADTGVAASMEQIGESVRQMQVEVGTAILGNAGVVDTILQLTEVTGKAVSFLTNSVILPAIKGWRLIAAELRSLVGGAASFIGELLGNDDLRRWGNRQRELGAEGVERVEQMFSTRTTSMGARTSGGRRSQATRDRPFRDQLTPLLTQELRPELAPGTNLGSGDTFARLLDKYVGPADLAALVQERLTVGLASVDVESAVQPLAERVGQTIGDLLGQGIEAGFQRAFESGSITEGFKGLAGAMLSAFGDAIVQFGKVTIKAGVLMDGILKSLANLIPGGAIVRGAALIALGSALKGAAQAAFGGGGVRSSSFAVPSGVGGTSAAVDAASGAGQLTLILPKDAIIDGNSVRFQDWLSRALAQASGRKVVTRYG